MKGRSTWHDALHLHWEAADGFAHAAESLCAEAWLAPVGEGKWTPAQITDHLVRAYEVLLRELGGGPGMALRTRTWQRLLLRFTLVPRLLRGDPFPAGARAPRETRPTGEDGEDRDVLLARFRGLADEFHAAVQSAYERDPRQRLTHAYFGASSLEKSVVLCARHILHHRQQLPAGQPSDQTPA